jgi:hypothetical protein
VRGRKHKGGGERKRKGMVRWSEGRKKGIRIGKGRREGEQR